MKTQTEIRNAENGSVYYEVFFNTISTKLLTTDEYDRISLIIRQELDKK